MSVLDANISACLDRFDALESRCDQNENLHILGTEAESILVSVVTMISSMPVNQKMEQKIAVERKLMSATRRGKSPWKHIANFALEKFKVLVGNC